MHDVVWFTPDHQAEALSLVRRLSLPEIRERGLDQYMQGLRISQQGIPIPKEDAVFSGTMGRCVMTNLHGTKNMNISGMPTIQGEIHVQMAKLCSLKVLKEGLVVGDWLPDLWDRPEWAKAAEDQHFVERDGAAHSLADREERALDLQAKREDAVRRYLVASAHLAGVKNPSRISSEELADINIAAEMRGDEMTPMHTWMERFAPAPPAAEVPELYKRDPVAYADKVLADHVERKDKDLSTRKRKVA